MILMDYTLGTKSEYNFCVEYCKRLCKVLNELKDDLNNGEIKLTEYYKAKREVTMELIHYSGRGRELANKFFK